MVQNNGNHEQDITGRNMLICGILLLARDVRETSFPSAGRALANEFLLIGICMFSSKIRLVVKCQF